MVHIIATNGEISKAFPPPTVADAILSAPPDCLLFRSDDRVTLYDVQQELTLGELKMKNVKAAIWQDATSVSHPEGPLVALLCRGIVAICNRRLELLYAVPETLIVKSGVWDEVGTFIYTTMAHVKYCLPPFASGTPASSSSTANDVEANKNRAGQGDHGILRTLDRVIYVAAAQTRKCA